MHGWHHGAHRASTKLGEAVPLLGTVEQQQVLSRCSNLERPQVLAAVLRKPQHMYAVAAGSLSIICLLVSCHRPLADAITLKVHVCCCHWYSCPLPAGQLCCQEERKRVVDASTRFTTSRKLRWVMSSVPYRW